MSDKQIVEVVTRAAYDAAESKLADALDLLRVVEWAGSSEGDRACPVCGSYSPPKHEDDCGLARVLSESPE